MGPEVSTLLDLLSKGGPSFIAAFCIIMWWLERRDRVRLQTERDALLERVITSQLTGAQSMRDIREAIDRIPSLSARRGS